MNSRERREVQKSWELDKKGVREDSFASVEWGWEWPLTGCFMGTVKDTSFYSTPPAIFGIFASYKAWPLNGDTAKTLSVKGLKLTKALCDQMAEDMVLRGYKLSITRTATGFDVVSYGWCE